LKLSIITVNLNNSSGLQKTIESVISQTSHNFEYIIIDGGSTDGSVDIIHSFTGIPQGEYIEMKEPRDSEQFGVTNHDTCDSPSNLSKIQPLFNPIVYWISEKDNGIFHAMNKGIKVAKGEYCQFLNSGDWLASTNVIGIMLTYLPDCSIFYGNMLKQMSKGKIYRDTCEKGNISMLTFYRGTINHSPAFIKRSLFEKYGLYDETLQITADWKWYLIVIAIKNEPVNYVNVDVTCFNMNGISNSNYILAKSERRKVLEELLPIKILQDYETHWKNIDQMNRINSYRITRLLFWFFERLVFKWEKFKLSREIIK